MKTKNSIISILALLALVVSFWVVTAPVVQAERATQEEMQKVCQNWLSYMVYQEGVWAGETRPQIVKVDEIVEGDTLLARCFSIAPKGYIVVPILKELPPIKAYSEDYGLDVNQRVGFPQLLREILVNRIRLYVKRYGSLDAAQPPTGDVLLGREHRQEWNRFLKSNEDFKTDLRQGKFEPLTTVGPLLTTAWHQGAPYNNLCPWGDGGRCVVGCVATAAAQIMKYWNWPPCGVGSHTDNWNGDQSCGGTTAGGPLSATFSDCYDWENMPNNCDAGCTPAQEAALAELSYEVGVAFNMDYGRCGSGAYPTDALTVFPTYFRYNPSMIGMEDRSAYTPNSWFSIIQTEINNGRPILYSIWDTNFGHSIVCDGWRVASSQNQYHMNYGWGGPQTLWYVLDDLYCGGNPCTSELIIRGIAPPTDPIEKGLTWLRCVQNPNGSWEYIDGTGDGNVGATALAAVAFINNGVDPTNSADVVKPALDWILTQGNADGSFGTSNQVYQTSLAIWALVAAMAVTTPLIKEDPLWESAVSAAKNYLLSVQCVEPDYQPPPANPNYGGWGYPRDFSPLYPQGWADLSNTQFAVFGLKIEPHDAEHLPFPYLTLQNLGKAIDYISSCQQGDWGFKYAPDKNNWGGGNSYGSMTAAGIWGLYCCKVNSGNAAGDSRVMAAKDWIFGQTNYYSRNPGADYPDLFYYYYAMTAMKAFTMVWHSKVVGGYNWYNDFSGELVSRQNPEGWWRGPDIDPYETEFKVWATAEAITALETWATTLPTGVASWELSCHADLIVYDPDGNRCKIDCRTGVVECNIPGAVCSGPNPSVITISAPQVGEYKTEVVEREEGWYRLVISAHLNQALVSSDTSWQYIKSGETDEWSTILATVFYPMTMETNFPPSTQPPPTTVVIPNTDSCVNPGDYVSLPILLENSAAPFGGFELEVEFDYTAMTFVGAEMGKLLTDLDSLDPGPPPKHYSWEYFKYRMLPCPACACCKYKILLLGMNDIPNGPTNVGVPIPAGSDGELVLLHFVVNNDENLRGFKIPVCWEWEGTVQGDSLLIEDWDCNENTFSNSTGNVLYTSKLLCQFNQDLCDAPAGGVEPILIFQNGICGQNCGGVDVCPAGPGFCKRGDVNYNTLPYEVADVVLFASYFARGIEVFSPPDSIRSYQICATDVNADGRTLTLSDLVYLIRVILHDAVPIPKLAPSSEIANVTVSNNIITTECASPIGAILFEFDGGVVPTLLAKDMEMIAKDNKILVWSRDGHSIEATSQVVKFIGEANLVNVTAVDGDSRELKTSINAKVAPIAFALNPAYPNPFNPNTNLSFTLPEALSYNLKIYNVVGQLVRSYEGIGKAGLNVITWDSKDNAGDEVASGIYFYKLTAGSFSATQKMVVMK